MPQPMNTKKVMPTNSAITMRRLRCLCLNLGVSSLYQEVYTLVSKRGAGGMIGCDGLCT